MNILLFYNSFGNYQKSSWKDQRDRIHDNWTWKNDIHYDQWTFCTFHVSPLLGDRSEQLCGQTSAIHESNLDKCIINWRDEWNDMMEIVNGTNDHRFDGLLHFRIDWLKGLQSSIWTALSAILPNDCLHDCVSALHPDSKSSSPRSTCSGWSVGMFYPTNDWIRQYL